jgi:von Willebrand factor type D domain
LIIREGSDGLKFLTIVSLIKRSDPHFRTYDGTFYSFHGQCDLVMARSPSFDNGVGLEVHARTELVTNWSLIKSAAVRLGKDTFEFANDGSYYFNGSKNVEMSTVLLAGEYTVSKQEEIIDVTVNGVIEQEPKLFITIDLGNNDSIQMHLWKHMISVKADIQLEDSEGMLGVWGKTGLVGRDRDTLALDANDMGFQWQVRDTEPMLFHDVQMPQFPQQCVLPSVDKRRLRQVSVEFQNSAEEACANVDSRLQEFCVKDVILTGDVNVAHGYGSSSGFGF